MPAKPRPATKVSNKSDAGSDIAAQVKAAQANRRKHLLAEQAEANKVKRDELAKRHAEGQLALWPEAERGIPNELVRSAVFSAKNRKMPREVYGASAPLIVPVIGGGEIVYIGEELRQDDETVWMQLVNLAKESRSEWVSFTPHSFLKTIDWTIKGDSYTRLLTSIRRLKTSGLEVYSGRFDKGVSTALITNYEYSKNEGASWKVHVFNKDDQLFFLFDKLYSRLDWQTRLALPEGVATWLHGFFCSHREPFDHKIETLAVGAGLKIDPEEDQHLPALQRTAKRKERLREARKTIIRALEALKAAGFLEDFQVTKKGIVIVRRKNDLRAIL